MSGPRKPGLSRRVATAPKKAAPPPIPVPPISPVLPSLVPPNLCSPQDIQQGFASFENRTSGGGEPLITVNDAATASAKTLAAESLVHSTEGWRFMSSALSALLTHGQKQAVHYAYYAELRAAVSILASHGLRVKYPNSRYLNNSGAEEKPGWEKKGTHSLVWKLWSDWAATSSAETLFLDGLKVHPAVSLRNFKDAISIASASINLKAWARDLQLENEHTARNSASYEAAYSRESFSFMDADDFSFLTEIWALAEPTAVGLQFEVQLVNWMLRKAAEDQEKEQMKASGTPGGGAILIHRVLTEVEGATGISVAQLTAALSLSKQPSKIFDFAFSSDVDSKNITARAFFLLRLSIIPIGVAFEKRPNTLGKTWLRDWLAHSGIFDPSLEIEPADIWADYEHLSMIKSPALPLPAQLLSDSSLAQDTLKLARPDALLAWSVPL